VAKVRGIATGIALFLYLIQFFIFRFTVTPVLLIVFKSMCWMLAIFGYGFQCFTKPSGPLVYLGRAVYPIYIIHMLVQYTISYYFLPLPLLTLPKLSLLLMGTFDINLFKYGYGIERDSSTGWNEIKM